MLHSSSTTTPPIGQRRCPVCGRPMFLARIEPAGEVGEEIWTFECLEDPYVEMMVLPIL